MRCTVRWWFAAAACCLAACSVRPAGWEAERARAQDAGAAYAAAWAQRELPELSSGSGLEPWVAHAERGNGDLEAAFERWQAALEQVPQAGTQDTTAMLGAEHRLDGGSALDRSGVALMSDAMNNLLLPGRLDARAAAALAQAKVAAAAFDRRRLQLRREVAEAFWALALGDEEIRLQQQLGHVLALQLPSARASVTAGGEGQAALLAAEVAVERAEATLAGLVAGRPALVAALRARAGVPTGRFDPRPQLAALRPLDEGEQAWLERALRHNPDLELARAQHAAAAAEVAAREWLRVPEFSLRGLLGGDGAVDVAAAVTLPFLRQPAIEAAVRQAEAELRAAEAMRRQAGQDGLAAVLGECSALAAAVREHELLHRRVLPAVRQMARSARARWSTGTGAFATWAEAAVAEVEVVRRLAQLQAAGLLARARLGEAAGGP